MLTGCSSLNNVKDTPLEQAFTMRYLQKLNKHIYQNGDVTIAPYLIIHVHDK